MKDLHGRAAVVTGGASGIGYAIAKQAGARGMRVILADIEAGAVDRAAAELRAAGVDALGVATDVADATSVANLASVATDAFGPIHLLVNNAGVGYTGRAWRIKLSDWQWVMGVCFWGAVHGVTAFVPGMIEHGEDAHEPHHGQSNDSHHHKKRTSTTQSTD